MVYDKSPLDSILEMTFPTDPRLRPKVKEEIDATVSQLPLEENDAILSYIHYFSTDRGHKILIAGLRRAGRYRPLVQRILDDEGVPQELIYLAQIESGFLPRARSNKSAVGMWQFVQFRGRQYGLNQTPGTDDRLDPEKATRAAAKHLHDLYAEFGDWYLAMAAYNCGPGCVEHAVERTGFADFWELADRNALPQRDRQLCARYPGAHHHGQEPQGLRSGRAGLGSARGIRQHRARPPTSLTLIADASARPVSELQDLNPALLKPMAPAGYQLRVPKGTSATIWLRWIRSRPSIGRTGGFTGWRRAKRWPTSLTVTPLRWLLSRPPIHAWNSPKPATFWSFPSDMFLPRPAARVVASAHHSNAHRTPAAERAAVANPARAKHAGAYKTASLATAKRHASAD